MIKCTINPGNIFQNSGAGDTVYLSIDEAEIKRAEGVLHFEDPPIPKPEIEVKEEEKSWQS